jgi:hypothetical protein
MAEGGHLAVKRRFFALKGFICRKLLVDWNKFPQQQV